jgi:hypothetical protein
MKRAELTIQHLKVLLLVDTKSDEFFDIHVTSA